MSRFTFFLLGFLVAWPVHAQGTPARTTVLGAHDGHEGVGTLEFLEDPSQALTFTDILRPEHAARFRPTASAAPNLGFTRSSYWFRMRVHNRTSEHHFLLEPGYPHLDRVDLYAVGDDGKVQVQHGGDLLPFNARPVDYHGIVFDVSIAPGAHETLYLKVVTEGSLQLPLRLWTMKAFTEAKLQEMAGLFLYYGIILVMILYNVFLFFSIRDLNYLIYVCYLISWSLYQLSLNGLAYQYLWPNSPVVANLAIAPLGFVVTIFLVVFARRFLQTATNSPLMHRLLGVELAIVYVGLPLSLVLSMRAAIMSIAASSLVAAVMILAAGVVCLVRGYRPARFFVLAFVALLVGVIVVAARTYGMLPGAALAMHGMQVGSAIEVILLSLALADRIKNEQLIYQTRIEKLNQDLIEKERARTAFFHNTSHELRTPLNGILAFVDLLVKGQYGELGERARGQLGKVSNLARSLLLQVNAILELARSRAGQLTLVNTAIPLAELADEARVVAEGLAVNDANRGFAVELGWDRREEQLFVGDREKLSTILRNLIGNAFKFSDPSRFNQVTLSLSLDARRELTISVSDTGIGIDRHHHDEVFEEFKQVGDSSARRAHEGTGLGLTLVKKLADLMNGRVELDSTKGRGSTFTVVIPEQEVQHAVQLEAPSPDRVVNPEMLAASLPELRPALRLAPPKVQSGDAPYILVVDDNQINGEVVRDVLGAHGYGVEHLSVGAEAMQHMEQRTPDLLLLDLMMPDVSGEDVLKAMKHHAQLRNVPIIVLTARASEEDRIRALKLGADDYLAKPLLADELVLRVHNTLARLGLTHALAERRAIEESLAAAQKVRSALARELATIPEVALSDHYESAESTGGDWFGVSYDPQKRRIFALIGDVTGHGMPSALITLAASGAAKGCLAALRELPDTQDKAQALRTLCAALDQAVRDAAEGNGRTMTMALVCVDIDSGEGHYLNAGHNEVYVLGESGLTVLLEAGKPLGSAGPLRVGERAFRLAKDDTLFLHTDGLVENTGPAGETLGKRALTRLLKSHAHPEALKASLLARCRELWRDHPPDDDCAFLALRLSAQTRSESTIIRAGEAVRAAKVSSGR